jgi:hypothetical protein
MKIVPSTTLCLLLTACVATTDLKLAGALSDADRQTAQTMAEQASAVCTYVRMPKGWTSSRDPQTVKFEHLAEIRKFYRSDSGWYKAAYFADGIDSTVYYNVRTKTTVCTDDGWNRLSNSRIVSFVEVHPR